jgi:hypothetical protein
MVVQLDLCFALAHFWGRLALLRSCVLDFHDTRLLTSQKRLVKNTSEKLLGAFRSDSCQHLHREFGLRQLWRVDLDWPDAENLSGISERSS